MLKKFTFQDKIGSEGEIDFIKMECYRCKITLFGVSEVDARYYNAGWECISVMFMTDNTWSINVNVNDLISFSIQ